MSDPDIVVVGAGAAGIGASLALTRFGIDHVVLEARSRVGGRAFTDRSSLPVAWDQGCHWLHCADVNPLARICEKIGHQYLNRPVGDLRAEWRDGQWLDKAGRDAVFKAIDEPFEAIDSAAAAGRDVAISEVFAFAPPHGRIQRHWVQLMCSGDPEEVSTVGYADYDDTGHNWPVKDGYGALIERLAGGCPVRLDTPVGAVRQRSGGVTVETGDGDIAARAAIVTCPTNVLLSGSLTLDHDGVDDLIHLMAATPCGYYEKVAIAFDVNPFGDDVRPYANIDRGVATENRAELPINFQLAPFGAPVAIGHMAGGHARDMAAAGEAAMTAYGLDLLADAFGHDIRKRVVASAVTGWTHDPWTRGGYSYARPGQAGQRHAMIALDTPPVFYAGEAFSRPWQATAHGAWVSGADAAHKAAKLIGRDVPCADYEWLPDG